MFNHFFSISYLNILSSVMKNLSAEDMSPQNSILRISDNLIQMVTRLNSTLLEVRLCIMDSINWYSDLSLRGITAMLVLPETCNMFIFSEPPDRALAHKYHFYYHSMTQLRATETRSMHVDPA